MTHVMLLLAHPRRTSFCHAIAEAVAAQLVDLGHDVRSHDLYAELFDPLLSAAESHTTGVAVESVVAHEPDPVIARHREELRDAEGLVVVHPNWWGMPPAILTGWIDRVVVPGVAYRLADPVAEPVTLSPLRELFVINTSDTTPEREEAVFGDPLAAIWGRCLPPFVGDPRVTRRVLRPVADSTDAQRVAWMAELVELAGATFGRARELGGGISGGDPVLTTVDTTAEEAP